MSIRKVAVLVLLLMPRLARREVQFDNHRYAWERKGKDGRKRRSNKISGNYQAIELFLPVKCLQRLAFAEAIQLAYLCAGLSVCDPRIGPKVPEKVDPLG